MPINAADLIEGKPLPISVKVNEKVQLALELMIDNDYSQLPVVDNSGKPLGLINADSILRGLANFGATVDQLGVKDVMIKYGVYNFDVGITDLLNGLKTYPAVLITDNEGHLRGIITDWDTTEYFRGRSEDMMLIEDIETALKDHVLAEFTNSQTGLIEEYDLQFAIDTVSNAQTFSTAKNAIKKYLSLIPENQQKLDIQAYEEVCKQLYQGRKSLKDMTLYQLMELLLYKPRWELYGSNFSIDGQGIRKMLTNVQQIRNTLAHFRDELTPSQKEALRFCSGWLDRNPPIIPEITQAFQETEIKEEQDPISHNEIIPSDEEVNTEESRYAQLAYYLQTLQASRIQLTFEEIEAIIGSNLPPSARQHRSWWANDSVGHVQSKQWLETGWRVASINLTNGVITFVRSKERETAYIEFFSKLLSELRENAHFSIRKLSPMGASWHNIGSYDDQDGKTVASLTFAFTRTKKFRVELYIDCGDGIRNKNIFDVLEPKIITQQHIINGDLRFERLDERRASRIAVYVHGVITDQDAILNQLSHTGMKMMIEFYNLLTPIMTEHGFNYRG